MAKIVKKKIAKNKKKEVVKNSEPTTTAEFIEQTLSKMLHEIDNYDFDGLNDQEVRAHLGAIGQRYAMMSAEFPDGRAVIGYKRVYKVMLLGQTPAEAAQGRG